MDEALLLFIDNDQQLYKQMQQIERALMNKIVLGKYDPARAPAAFAYLTEAAAKKYIKEFGESEELSGTWNVSFPKKVRDVVNKDLAERFWGRIQKDPHYVAELAKLRESRSGSKAAAPGEMWMCRYVHKISSNPADKRGPFRIPNGAWSDSKKLAAALRQAGALIPGARIKSFRAEGERVIVFPTVPGLTTYWHSLILTPHIN